MFTRNKICIPISIFYPRNGLGQLFKGCLKELLFETFRLKYNYQFLLSLSAKRGENLQISLLMDPDDVSLAVSYLDEKLRHYLKSNQAPSDINDFPLKSFFRDIDVNNIHYRLFNCQEHESSLTLHYSLIISELLLKVFSEEELQDESLMAFSLYLHFAVLKYTLSFSKTPKIYLHLFHSYILSQTDTSDCSFYTEKYKENLNEIDFIVADIFSPNFRPDLEWLHPWLDMCHNTFYVINNEQLSNEILLQKHLDISRIILKHLNFNKTAENLINIFMYQKTITIIG